jgi:hypothetical protein
MSPSQSAASLNRPRRMRAERGGGQKGGSRSRKRTNKTKINNNNKNNNNNNNNNNHEQPHQGQGPMVQMQLGNQGQALRPDAGPFGDLLGKKPPNTLRIGVQNFGGFPLCPLDAKNESLREFVSKNDFDILGIPENNACWHLLPTEARLHDRMSGWWEALQINSAYWATDPNAPRHQHGGVTQISVGKAAHRVESFGVDPSGLGRWV